MRIALIAGVRLLSKMMYNGNIVITQDRLHRAMNTLNKQRKTCSRWQQAYFENPNEENNYFHTLRDGELSGMVHMLYELGINY